MSIKEKLQQFAGYVRTKVYGREVREAIADGLQAVGEVSENTEYRQTELEGKFDNLDSRWDTVVSGTTNGAEVIEARGGFTTLKNRLDNSDTELNGLDGRNLITDARLERWIRSGTSTIFSMNKSSPTNIIRVDLTAGAAVTFMGAQDIADDRQAEIQQGVNYTLSYEIRGNVTNMNYTFLMRIASEGGNISFPNQNVQLSETEWTKVTHTRSAPWSTRRGGVLIATRDVADGKWFEIRNVKLEQGVKATGFSLPPEHTHEHTHGIATASVNGFMSAEQSTRLNAAQLKKITQDSGAPAINITDTSRNFLADVQNAGTGLHTFYAAGGTRNAPGTRAIRGLVHLTGSTNGWVQAVDTANNVFINFLASGTWSGWSSVTPALTGISSREGQARIGNLLIQWGSETITPKSPGVTEVKRLRFPQAYSNNPNVIVSASTSVPGSTVRGVSVTNTTTTHVDICVNRTNTTNTTVLWQAIGRRA